MIVALVGLACFTAGTIFGYVMAWRETISHFQKLRIEVLKITHEEMDKLEEAYKTVLRENGIIR